VIRHAGALGLAIAAVLLAITVIEPALGRRLVASPRPPLRIRPCRRLTRRRAV